MAKWVTSADVSGHQPIPPKLVNQITTKLPGKLKPFLPEFKTLAQIAELRAAKQKLYDYKEAGTGFNIAAGYTDARLSLRFEDFASQWQKQGDFWVYKEGSINLDLKIVVYADDRMKPPNKPSCLVLVVNHELLHVADEIDIATNWLAKAADEDAYVKSNLAPGSKVPAKRFDTDIRGSAGDGSGSYLEKRIIQQVYLPESSSRSAALHKARPKDIENLSKCLGG